MGEEITDGKDGSEALREGEAGPATPREAYSVAAPVEEVALNRLLEADPRSVLLNIRKAEWRLRALDDEVACYFYHRALRFARERPLSDAESAKVPAAEAALAEAEARLYAKREKRLIARGLPPAQWSPRLRASLEPSADRRGSSLQDPTHHFYPGLPDIEFYDRSRFDWAPAVEAATAAIREELIGFLTRGTDGLRPFMESDLGLPLGVSKALPKGGDWRQIPLCEQGWVVPDNVQRCPVTWETMLRDTPVPRVAGWGPSAVFSLLKPGAHIGTHTGMYNTRLICHLPLIVPPGCRFRVGNEIREWEEGKLLIFDDTIEHEAWNEGTEDRVVLIFDVWRPELTEQEKSELSLLYSD